MTPKSPQIYNGLSIVSLILFLIPLFILIMWIVTFESNPSLPQAEKVEIFKSYFPSFLRSNSSISLTGLIAAAASLLFALVGKRGASRVLKVICLLVIILAPVVLLLQLFSMM